MKNIIIIVLILFGANAQAQTTVNPTPVSVTVYLDSVIGGYYCGVSDTVISGHTITRIYSFIRESNGLQTNVEFYCAYSNGGSYQFVYDNSGHWLYSLPTNDTITLSNAWAIPLTWFINNSPFR